MHRLAVVLIGLSLCSLGCDKPKVSSGEKAPTPADGDVGRVEKSDSEWKKILSPEAYKVLRLRGTERARSGEYWDMPDAGTYQCAGCGLTLFSSDAKFESKSGWPSYWQPISANRVKQQPDTEWDRTEVVCARCGGHLGHVFNDGPKPTGLRYCMNSVAMKFIPAPVTTTAPATSPGEAGAK